MEQLEKGHLVSKGKLAVSIPKAKPGEDEFLVAPVPLPEITGVQLQAALQVCYPVMMSGDFTFWVRCQSARQRTGIPSKGLSLVRYALRIL